MYLTFLISQTTQHSKYWLNRNTPLNQATNKTEGGRGWQNKCTSFFILISVFYFNLIFIFIYFFRRQSKKTSEQKITGFRVKDDKKDTTSDIKKILSDGEDYSSHSCTTPMVERPVRMVRRAAGLWFTSTLPMIDSRVGLDSLVRFSKITSLSSVTTCPTRTRVNNLISQERFFTSPILKRSTKNVWWWTLRDGDSSNVRYPYRDSNGSYQQPRSPGTFWPCT